MPIHESEIEKSPAMRGLGPCFGSKGGVAGAPRFSEGGHGHRGAGVSSAVEHRSRSANADADTGSPLLTRT